MHDGPTRLQRHVHRIFLLLGLAAQRDAGSLGKRREESDDLLHRGRADQGRQSKPSARFECQR